MADRIQLTTQRAAVQMCPDPKRPDEVVSKASKTWVKAHEVLLTGTGKGLSDALLMSSKCGGTRINKRDEIFRVRKYFLALRNLKLLRGERRAPSSQNLVKTIHLRRITFQMSS